MKFKTEKEIFSQYEALNKTYKYILGISDKIKNLISKISYDSLTFIGCGSSYSLCKSACVFAKIKLGIASNSIAAGDLMLNFPTYLKLMKNTLLITLSRSGSTSELIEAVKKTKKEFNRPIISICANKNSKIAEIADLNLEIPWAFDESVCQTRTVSNLYIANLLLIGILANDLGLFNGIKLRFKK